MHTTAPNNRIGRIRRHGRSLWRARSGVRAARLPARVASERGQALAEFVLVLPILLLVLFGIVQFGLALNSENDETHIANEVARYAIVNENPGGAETLQQWAKNQGDNGFLKGNGKVCISFPEGAAAGKPIKVEATSVINWLPILNIDTLSTTLKGTAYMRLETVPSAYKAGCST